MPNLVEVHLSCCMCRNKHDGKTQIPEGWENVFLCEERALCPQHAIIERFKESQCPGCVGGFGECDLFRAFAFSTSDGLTDRQYAELETGVCPKRTNGTLMVSSASIEDIDLRDPPDAEAGKAFAQAIRDYETLFKSS